METITDCGEGGLDLSKRCIEFGETRKVEFLMRYVLNRALARSHGGLNGVDAVRGAIAAWKEIEKECGLDEHL